MSNDVKKKITFILIGLFLVVGVPILINESYKLNRGYLTLWNASDVLAYYGLILQGIINIYVLSQTILYTRRQIDYEHKENVIKSKMNIIKDELNKYVNCLYPLILYKIYQDGNKNHFDNNCLINIVNYQIELKLASNHMNCLLAEYDDLTSSKFFKDLMQFQERLIDCADKFILSISEKTNNSIIIDELIELSKNDYTMILNKQKELLRVLEDNGEEMLNKIIK